MIGFRKKSCPLGGRRYEMSGRARYWIACLVSITFLPVIVEGQVSDLKRWDKDSIREILLHRNDYPFWNSDASMGDALLTENFDIQFVGLYSLSQFLSSLLISNAFH